MTLRYSVSEGLPVSCATAKMHRKEVARDISKGAAIFFKFFYVFAFSALETSCAE